MPHDLRGVSRPPLRPCGGPPPLKGRLFQKTKGVPLPHEEILALLLTLASLAGLTACKDTEVASTAQEQHTVTAPTNDATFVYQPDDPAPHCPAESPSCW